MYEPLGSEAHVFTRKKALIQGRFENTPAFIKYLNSVGTGFSHPNKNLTLRDLFVYPELKLANVAAKNIVSIHGEQVLQFVSTSEYLQIAGAPTSGKSTLARALYLDLKHEFNLVPLLLEASSLKGSSIEDLEKAITQSFSQQYRDASPERFLQLARERKVLLIDDWHKLRIAGKARKKLLDGLRSLSGKVVVFSDDIPLLQLLADVSEDGSASYGEYCEIKQFGYRLRSELIRKWHNIGTDLGIDDMELTSKISASENLLDTLVRKGTVPFWPIFILSVLQASSLAVEETALYGSYGHLYEALLTRRMADASRKRQTLGQKYTYLSMVAYRLFHTGISSLSESALREIHRRYELEYQVTENAELLWQELQDAQVLLRSGDDFSFQYKYAYYFFVAKYFQQGMADLKGANALRAQLAYMVRCVHDEDSANILIFYLYLTKDRDLIEEMLGVASRIFYEKQPALLTSDVEFVNRLRSRSPDVLLQRNDIDQNRNERRAQMDASEQIEQENPHAIEKTEYSDTISDALKIEFAFKSLQVMGQVVKNFPLDLKGDLKVALTKQSYELTLRTLRTYLSLIETNMAEILDLFDHALRAFQPFSKKSAEEIRDASQAMTVRLTEFAIFGMLKRLSLAVGVPDLKETYYQVRQMVSEDDVAARLIDLCIKLDHFGQIPENDVRGLEQRLRSNITAYTVLKLLVADFLHLFPCNYKVEQRMVQLFKFQPHVTKLTEKRVKRLN